MRKFAVTWICALALAGLTACGAETEEGKTAGGTGVSVEEYELTGEEGVLSEQEKQAKYQSYLARRVEEEFASAENIDSAIAVVDYDKEQDEYSIEVSLTTIGNIKEEELALFEEALGKTYAGVTLLVNGEKVLE